MVVGVKSHLESNPIPSRDAQRAQTYLMCTWTQRAHRDRQNCVWVPPEEVQVSSRLLQGQELWVQQTWVWHKPSWRTPLTPSYSRRNLHRTGEILEENKQNLVCTSTQEKGAVTPQETDPDLPVRVQQSPAEAWVGGGLLQAWGP